MKNNKGITLVALIVTIIILLILAGITIALTVGDNGILNKAEKAGEEYIKASIKEELELAILDINAELASKTPPEGLTKQAIIDGIQDHVQEMITIDDGLNGNYKDYNYWIDDNYEVHIGDKYKNPIQVELKTTYVGTTSSTFQVEATSSKGNIVGYQYKISNKVMTEQMTEKEYTNEELEPNTTYTVVVIAIDEVGNRRSSLPIKITTKERTYIIKDGVQQVEGHAGIDTLIQENGYSKLTISPTNLRGGYYFYYDLSKYKRIIVDMEVTHKDLSSNGCAIFSGICVENPYESDLIELTQITSFTDTAKVRETYNMDTENLTGTYCVCIIKNATYGATGASIKIYNIWLEE